MCEFRYLKMIIILLFLALACPVFAAPSTTGLIAYWTFNGTPNDSSVNGNYLSNVSGVTVYATGIKGQGVYFNGTGNSGLFRTTDNYYMKSPATTKNITIAYWVYWNGSSVGERTIIAAADAGCGNDLFYLSLTASDSRPIFQLYKNNCNAETLSGNTSLSSSTWYFVVGTANATNETVYVYDTTQLRSTISRTFASFTYYTGFDRTLLGLSDMGVTPFTGVLDEVRYYNRTLSASEVDQLWIDGLGDYAAPTIAIQSPTAQTYSTPNITVNFTATDISGIDTCMSEFDGAANVTRANCNNFTMTNLNDSANHVLKIFANDTYGNMGSASATFATDSLSPTVSIQSPIGKYNSSNISLLYTVSDIVGITGCWYVLDSGNVNLPSCANTSVGVSEGFHNITVYANDTANNSGSIKNSFSIDFTSPTVIVQFPEAKNYAFQNQSVNFTAHDSSGLDSCKYELDGSSNITISGCNNFTLYLADSSSHTLKISANDSYGNMKASSVTFGIDSSIPDVEIQSPTEYALLNVSDVPLDFTAVNTVNITGCWYELDGNAADLPLCDNTTLVAVSEGFHNITVYANDTVNSTGNHTHYFRTDYTPPLVTVTEPSGVKVKYSLITVAFNVTDANGYDVNSCEYSIDGGARASLVLCADQAISYNATGSHNITVFANDSAGNQGNGTSSFEYDEILPQWSNIMALPPSPVTRNTTEPLNVTYNITVTDNIAVDTVLLRRANGTATTVKIGDVYTVTDLVGCGETQYGWDINDTSGNSNNTPYFIYSVSCAVAIPQITLSQPKGFYNVMNVTLEFTAYDNSSISQCWSTIDDLNFINVTGLCYNLTFANVSTTINATEGVHFITIYVMNMINLTNFTFSNFTVDLTPPAIAFTSPVGDAASGTNIPITYTVSDNLSGVNMSSCSMVIDGNASACLTQHAFPVGSHSVAVYFNDYAGNSGYAVTYFTASEKVHGFTAIILSMIPLVIALVIIASLAIGFSTMTPKEIITSAVMIIICLILTGIIYSSVAAIV